MDRFDLFDWLILIAMIIFVCGVAVSCQAQELWQITAYCAKECCCGKYADGITASGKEVKEGYCANNWLEFGSVVVIEDLGEYVVEDRKLKEVGE